MGQRFSKKTKEKNAAAMVEEPSRNQTPMLPPAFPHPPPPSSYPPPPTSNPPTLTPPPQREKLMKAVYNYDAERDDEMSVLVNDVVVFLFEDDEPTWFKARNVDTGDEGKQICDGTTVGTRFNDPEGTRDFWSLNPNVVKSNF